MEKQELFMHKDRLSGLTHSSRLNQKLAILHQRIQEEFPFITRIAVAIFDEKSCLLKTYLASMNDENTLVHYQSLLDDAPGLQEILETGQPRVVNDLRLFDTGVHLHTQLIREKGYASSYTFPIHSNGKFLGFLFFNSCEYDCFSEAELDQLDIFAHLIMEFVASERFIVLTMAAALKSAQQMVHYRDPETGNHLERMSRFARLIAIELSNQGLYRLDDEIIERIFTFAPMHDIGKIAIPDEILLKPSRLSEAEFAIMKTHTTRGRQIIDGLIDNFGLEAFDQEDVLKHIAELHHETLDGQGYPKGLHGEEIPLEARIIAVADIFDALTSERPYKPAWSNDRAFETLSRMARTKLDEDCIHALVRQRLVVEEIQQNYSD